jgi:hypothetical protein
VPPISTKSVGFKGSLPAFATTRKRRNGVKALELTKAFFPFDTRRKGNFNFALQRKNRIGQNCSACLWFSIGKVDEAHGHFDR